MKLRYDMTLPYTRIIGWDFTVNDNNEVVLIELNLHSPEYTN